MAEVEYETAEDRRQALFDAEAASRRAESEANVLRSRALRSGNRNGVKDALREAIKEEVEAQKKEQEVQASGVVRDLSGTAPTLSDSMGNFAPNPEVANVGGIGVEASNTKAGTDDQAQKPEDVDLSGATQAVGPEGEIKSGDAVEIPADWEGSHWRTRVALAEKISGRDDVKTEDANGIISAEVKRRG